MKKGFNNPEFLLGLLSLFYFILMILVSVIDLKEHTGSSLAPFVVIGKDQKIEVVKVVNVLYS